MTLQNRAAQFAPFAALSGYNEAVRETARLTGERIVLDESEIAVLNDKLQYLCMTGAEHQQVSITYFSEDNRKKGGSYVTISGTVRKIDSVFCYVTMDDGMKIPVKDIYNIEI